MKKILLCLILFACSLNCVSASGPLLYSVNVNGLDPSTGVVEVSPGQNVIVDVAVSNNGSGRIALLEFDLNVEPHTLNYLAKRYINQIIKGKAIVLESNSSKNISKSFIIPEVMPSGNYKIMAKIRYVAGENIYQESYMARFKVSGTGWRSRMFGFRIFPTDFIKQVLDTFKTVLNPF